MQLDFEIDKFTKLIGHYEQTLGAKLLYGQKIELAAMPRECVEKTTV